MNGIRKEWRKLFSNPLLVVTFFVVCIIPILYAGFFLKSVWDPYSATKDLQVAVVNNDRPVQYQGKRLAVGEDLVANLRNNDKLGWDFVDEQQAQQGMRDLKYYMIVTLPENFSKNATTALDAKPQKMVINYTTNPSYNFIGQTIAETGVKQLKEEVAHEVTAEYLNTIFDSLGGVKEGFKSANEGASKISSGASQISDGNSKINKNLKTLANSSLQFKNGSETLNVGLKKYVAGVAQARAGMNAVVANNDQLSGGISSAQSKLQQLPALQQGSNQVLAGLKALAENTALSADEMRAALNSQIIPGMTQVDGGINALANGGNDINTLFTGMQAYLDGARQVNDGLNQLNAESKKLLSGANQLNSGAGKIANGASALATGSNQLTSALSTLNSGASELSNKLAAGSRELNNLKTTDSTIKMMSNPDQLNHLKYSQSKNYGHGLAPYILSLGLYVGCLMFNLVIPVRKIADKSMSTFSWWLGKLSVGIAGALLMALVEATVMLMLGLEVVSLPEYYTMAITTALAYMFFIMFLSAILDNPGRFIATIILVLQLAASGGTFPISLSNSFFKALNPFLPMTYSILGFRQAIGGGLQDSTFVHSSLVMVAITVVSMILLLIGYKVLRSLHMEDRSNNDTTYELMNDDYKH